MIRPAGVADVPALLELWGSSRTAHAVSVDTPEVVGRLLDVAPGSVLLWVDPPSRVVLGSVVATFDGWRGAMYRLAVRADARRSGIGLALVRAGEARLRELGARRVNVLVAFEDDVARGLWGAAGYAADAEIGRMVRDLAE